MNKYFSIRTREGRFVAYTSANVTIFAILIGAARLLANAGSCSSGVLCLWEVSTHPLWIAVVAWLLASSYQARSQTRGLRFSVFERCALVHSRLVAATGDLFPVRALILAAKKPDVKVRGSLEDYLAEEDRLERQIDAAYFEGASIAVVNSALFSVTTQRLWLEMLGKFKDFRFEDSPRACRTALKEASEAWAAFVLAAAPEVSSRFRPVSMPMRERQETEVQVDEYLDKLEPK